MTEENTIRRNDEIAPARPSLTSERETMIPESRKLRGGKKTGKTAARTKRRKKRSEKFVRLSLELIKSKAYLTLTPSAARMLIQFLAKPGEAFGIPLSDPQSYQATFNFTYTDAGKLRCSRSTFLAVIEALVEHGFLDPVKRGGVYNGRKVSSVFRLSQRWKAFGTSGFHPVNYRRWAVTGGRETFAPVQE
jgi:hypothetical protein